MPSGEPPAPHTPLQSLPTRRRAEELALVLLAEGLEPRVDVHGGAFVLSVPARHAEAAREILEEWRREAAPRGAEPAPSASLDLPAGLAASLVLLAVFLVSGPRRAGAAWFVAGAADAARILAGEGFRTFTALTLHADVGHLLSNVLFGTFFLAAVCGALGAGVGTLLVVVAGALGNLANAHLYGSAHVSVGASTAVFAAVGILGGVGVVGRRRRGLSGRRAWLPLAAGLGLLAMLGTSERSDLSAHFFGFLAGALVGPLAGRVFREPPAWPVQWLAGLGTAALVGGCWWIAFRA